MTNGKKSCEFGRFTRYMLDETKVDVNKIGKKIGRMYWILITTLIALVINLIYFISTRGKP